MSDGDDVGFWQQQEQELQQQYEEFINGIPAPVSPVQYEKGNTSWDSQQATTAETVISNGFHLDHSLDDAIL